MRANVHQLLRRSTYLDARTRWELDLSTCLVDHQLHWTTDRRGARRLVGRCPHCHRHSHLDLDTASYEIPANEGTGGVLVGWLTCDRCSYGRNLRVCLPVESS